MYALLPELKGVVTQERKVLSPADPGEVVYFFGVDRVGRDIFSRVVHGARISLSIGLTGAGISLVLGILMGGIWGIAAAGSTRRSSA